MISGEKVREFAKDYNVSSSLISKLEEKYRLKELQERLEESKESLLLLPGFEHSEFIMMDETFLQTCDREEYELIVAVSEDCRILSWKLSETRRV